MREARPRRCAFLIPPDRSIARITTACLLWSGSTGPQLLLQAFLQRIVNSGGRIEREYGLGRGRTDLLVIWPYEGGLQQVVIELKLLHHSLERTLSEGLAQTWAYMDRCGTHAGHLVIFDRDKTRPWEEKIFQREEIYQGRKIAVWGM